MRRSLLVVLALGWADGRGEMATDATVEKPIAAGKHTIDLLAGSNFTGRVTTGGCCGDGTIVAIRRR